MASKNRPLPSKTACTYVASFVGVLLTWQVQPLLAKTSSGLIGHWKLQGDCRDHSGNDNHATNHGVDLARGQFNGKGAYLEVPSSQSLKLGARDFAFSAWVYT